MTRDNRNPIEIEYSLKLLCAGSSLEEANKQARSFYHKKVLKLVTFSLLSSSVLLIISTHFLNELITYKKCTDWLPNAEFPDEATEHWCRNLGY